VAAGLVSAERGGGHLCLSHIKGPEIRRGLGSPPRPHAGLHAAGSGTSRVAGRLSL